MRVGFHSRAESVDTIHRVIGWLKSVTVIGLLIPLSQGTPLAAVREAPLGGFIIEHQLTLPETPEAPRARLLAARTLPDLRRERGELSSLVADYPLDAAAREALERIGEISFDLGDYDECIRAFQAFMALETAPDRIRQAAVQTSIALLRSGRYEESVRELRQLRQNDPALESTARILEAEADALLALSRAGEAAALFEQLETRFPNDAGTAKVLLSRGLCAELLGRPEDARQFYRLLAEEKPTSVQRILAIRRLEDLATPLLPLIPPSNTRR